jgi:plasmid stabilization system protein ParE
VRPIISSRAAREDLRGIRGYIEQFNPFVADRVALGLIEAVDSWPNSPSAIGCSARVVVSWSPDGRT